MVLDMVLGAGRGMRRRVREGGWRVLPVTDLRGLRLPRRWQRGGEGHFVNVTPLPDGRN